MANRLSNTALFGKIQDESTRALPLWSGQSGQSGRGAKGGKGKRLRAQTQPYTENYGRIPNTDLQNGGKLCVGDYVSLVYNRRKCKGVVKFIGPLTGSERIRYGVDLDKARGDHSGKPDSDTRQYFHCRDKHGALVRKRSIIAIERPILNERITVFDKVQVKHRGQGVVRFVGAVGNTRGIWFGVELSKRKGKHDGTIRSVRYFTCKMMYGVHARLDALTIVTGRSNDAYSDVNVFPMKRHAVPAKPRRVTEVTKSDSISNVVHAKQEALKRQMATQNKPSIVVKAQPVETQRRTRKPALNRNKTLKILDKAHISKHTPNARFTDDYTFDEFEDQLGDGEFGIVYRCKSKKKTYKGKKRVYAVKKISKAKLHNINAASRQELMTRLREEILLLKKVRKQKRKKLDGYRNIVHFVDVYEERNHLWIVTNYCKGGDLWTYIEEQGLKSEEQCASIIRQILNGLLFLGNLNIAHLDLKPANILFVDEERTLLQIVDFGMSRVIPRLKKCKLLAGTPHFLAPEVIQGSYDVKADVWSVGVILFLLLFGVPPFFEDVGLENRVGGGDDGVFGLILQGFYSEIRPGKGPWFPEDHPVSPAVQDLIGRMLEKDLRRRISVKEALDHPWLNGAAATKTLDHTVHDALIKFSAECKFRVLISQIFSYKVPAKEQKRVREVFAEFDTNGDGKLSLEEFISGMKQFKLGYSDEQIKTMFQSLDGDFNEEIDVNELLTGFSYQRLVQSDERLYEAFCELDRNNDGKISKKELRDEIKRLKNIDDRSKMKMRKLLGDVPPDDSKEDVMRVAPKLDMSKVESAVEWADLDEDGEIDFEEWLRVLHPEFQETNVTPRHMNSTPTHSQTMSSFFKTVATPTEDVSMWNDERNISILDDYSDEEDYYSDEEHAHYVTDSEEEGERDRDTRKGKGKGKGKGTEKEKSSTFKFSPF